MSKRSYKSKLFPGNEYLEFWWIASFTSELKPTSKERNLGPRVRFFFAFFENFTIALFLFFRFWITSPISLCPLDHFHMGRNFQISFRVMRTDLKKNVFFSDQWWCVIYIFDGESGTGYSPINFPFTTLHFRELLLAAPSVYYSPAPINHSQDYLFQVQSCFESSVMELLPLKKLDETEVKFEKNVYNSKLWPDVFETSILGCLFEL